MTTNPDARPSSNAISVARTSEQPRVTDTLARMLVRLALRLGSPMAEGRLEQFEADIRAGGYQPDVVEAVLDEWGRDETDWPAWSELRRRLDEASPPAVPLVTYKPAKAASVRAAWDVQDAIDRFNRPEEWQDGYDPVGAWRPLGGGPSSREVLISLGVKIGAIRVAADGTVERAR